ncbi:hypothetical protein GCM10018790_70000 [Kitasatospora xanthocidica]|uniref:hypothetical protein n=1 Tax=Kitasatospora xanthocidica TaxID=83382 RepID=UPI001674AB1C|nr:hypothetical protein [Kitasatospora xanthocidica]GHF82265.1 hypothetical protein GCM10018790_70000 [Kitasatospora xanthocidica]
MTTTDPAAPGPGPEGPAAPADLTKPGRPRPPLGLASTLPVLGPAGIAATVGVLPWPVLPALTAALLVRACLPAPDPNRP